MRNFLLVVAMIAALWDPALAAPRKKTTKNSCATDFASLEIQKHPDGRYVFNEGLFKKIDKYCESGEYPFAGSGNHPELLLYLAYHCSGRNHDYFHVMADGSRHAWDHAAQWAGHAEDWRAVTKTKPTFEGVPDRVLSKWKSDILEDYDMFINGVRENPTSLSHEGELMAYLKLGVPFLGEDQLKEGIRLIASNRADRVRRTYSGFHSPRLFQFYKQQLRKELGLDYVPLADLDRHSNNVYMLTVDQPPAGNGLVQQDGLMIKQVFVAPHTWSHHRAGEALGELDQELQVAGRNYRVKIKAKAGTGGEKFAPAMEKLDFKGMWSDKKLTGMIIPHQNMGLGEAGAHDVMGEYRAYFEDHGFRFGRLKPVENFAEFLLEEIKSGRLDYLMREAHSSGGSSQLGNFTTKGAIATGKKKLAGGKEEVVHIYFPNEATMNSTSSIQFSHIAESMKARSEAGGKQLFYLDTACSGLGTSCNMAVAVKDPNLVVAGPDMGVSTFANDEASPIYHVLDGIRKGKNFSEMESKMLEHNTEREGTYALPHSQTWKLKLHGSAPRVTEVDMQLYENGRRVDVETAGRD